MPVAVVTDSVSCLPAGIAGDLDVKVVPMEVIHKGQVFRDGVDLTPSAFYKMLREPGDLPTTSAPPPETYLGIYEELAASGKDILVICASRKLTHVYDSAVTAARLFGEKQRSIRVEVLDSGTAAGAQGFVVFDAATAAKSGQGLGGVLQVAWASMKSVYVIVYFETLLYLARGGRVPQAVAWADSLLRIRPIIELRPRGKGVALLGRARSRQKAAAWILGSLKRRTANLRFRVMVQHTDAEAEAKEMAEAIAGWPLCCQALISDFTPVMGVHTGPGLVGVSYGPCAPTKIEN